MPLSRDGKAARWHTIPVSQCVLDSARNDQ